MFGQSRACEAFANGFGEDVDIPNFVVEVFFLAQAIPGVRCAM